MSNQFFDPFTPPAPGETLMKKNPMALSPHLIEYFLIIGYDELYIQEKIIKNFDSKTLQELELAEQKSKKLNPETKILNEYKCSNFPSILFSLGSNFSEGLENEAEIIKDVFPIPPSVLYAIIDNFIYEPISNDVVFSNIQNDVVNMGYAHIFYESKNILDNIRIYIPKAFVIISQYPFFNTFKSICKEILSQFKNKFLQIPIEIHLYNIVNFIPAPVDSDILMTLFPLNDLSEISMKCNTDIQLIELNRQKQYKLSKLSGYRDTEVDISVIFCILSSDIIIEIFIQILCGHFIAIFSNNVSLINMTIFIFQEMFYPLSDNENVKCLSPLKFFNSDMVQQNILGFACPYEELETFEKVNPDYKTLYDDEEETIGKMFPCDLILDLDKKKFEYLETENSENVQKISDFLKKVVSSHKDAGSNFEKALRNLSANLNEIAFKLTYGNKNQIFPDYFVEENQFNRKIQNLFYSFILEISNEFFKEVSKYSGETENLRDKDIKNKEDCALNEDEYLFFSLFKNTDFCNILINFIGGYSKTELELYRTPKMIFENLMNLKKLSQKLKEEKLNSVKISDNFYELIDAIYGKNNDKAKNISFLNFYKYYKEHMIKDIYDLVSNKYVKVNINKQVKTNIKYYYEYNSINLDKNLFLGYKYILDALPAEERNKLFNIEKDYYEEFKPLNLQITQRNIFNCIEQYLINNKSIDHIAVLNFCILNVLCLTEHKRTLHPFIFSIYKLFGSLPCSVRKYEEIIFSIALRLIKSNNKFNYKTFEKYFAIYDSCKELGLFLNDPLIYLLKEINELKVKDESRTEEIINKVAKEIEKTDTKKLYSLDCKKKPKEIMPILQMNINKPVSQSKLTFKSKHYNNGKKVEFKEIMSPIMIYNSTNEMLNKYLLDLNFDIINKVTLGRDIIHLIYYTQLLEDKFPKDINKFLLYCLIDEEKK